VKPRTSGPVIATDSDPDMDEALRRVRQAAERRGPAPDAGPLSDGEGSA
jgi:hypothetical protein